MLVGGVKSMYLIGGYIQGQEILYKHLNGSSLIGLGMTSVYQYEEIHYKGNGSGESSEAAILLVENQMVIVRIMEWNKLVNYYAFKFR